MRPLREAKARGVDITGETCPHYLMLSTDDYARFAGVIRVNPPVREERNQEPLWAALADGTVDMIATDHAPHSPEEKTRNDIWTVDCGFPGVETQMPLMLTEVNAGRFSICDYVRWSAVNPAKIWGLYPRKGVIQPGADADIAVVDLDARMVDRRRQAAIALQDHAVARPAREGPADPHAGARPLRDEGPHARRGHARLGPLGARDPADAAAANPATPTRPWQPSFGSRASRTGERAHDSHQRSNNRSPRPNRRRAAMPSSSWKT